VPKRRERERRRTLEDEAQFAEFFRRLREAPRRACFSTSTGPWRPSGWIGTP
jgi:hypothetical protein